MLERYVKCVIGINTEEEVSNRIGRKQLNY